jgi:signal transduction histidine kinase
MAQTTAASRSPWWWFAMVGPLLLAVLQVVGTFGASQFQPERRDIDVLAVCMLIAGPLALLGVRRYPLQVLAFVTVVTLGYLLVGYPYGPVVFSMVIAVIAAIVLGHRAAGWIAMGVVYFGHFAFRQVFTDEAWSWGQAGAVAAWALLALIAGEGIRVRRERAAVARQARAEIQRRQANEERLRIAHELHDVVAHHMSMINVQAGVALHLLDRRPEQAEAALAAIKEASKEGLTELRSLVDVLRDQAEAAPRGPTSMLESLDDLIERSGHAGLRVTKQVDGDVRPLPAAVSLAAFRIIQEAITNVVRHSGADHADIVLRYGEDVLTVRVDDDGRGGPRAHEFDGGSGLRGMHERAAALDGTLTVGASPAGGVRIDATLPMRSEP